MESEISNCTSTNLRTCLTQSERLGLTFIAQSSLLSLAALAVLGLLIIRNIRRYRKYAGNMKWSLVQQPADVYMLSLFSADCLQAIGGAMSVRWVDKSIVQVGPFCSAQGAIQQIGNTGVALGTLCIALHTFYVVWLRRGSGNSSLTGATIAVSVQWTFLILWVVIGWTIHRNDNYFTPTPYWCWISADFPVIRIAGDYAWLWLTLLVSVLAYILLFLWSMRLIVPDDTHCWRVRFQLARNSVFAQDGPASIRASRRLAPSIALLAYPITHSIMLLPLSIVRWLSFSNAFAHGQRGPSGQLPGQPPLAATIAIEVLYGLFGATNVALFLTTRRRLLLFEHPLSVLHERGLLSATAKSRSGYGVDGRAVSTTPNSASLSSSPSSSSSPSDSPRSGLLDLHDLDSESEKNLKVDDVTTTAASASASDSDSDSVNVRGGQATTITISISADRSESIA